MPSPIVTGLSMRSRSQQATDDAADAGYGRRLFDIRIADSHGQQEAGILVDRMYATRGYLSNGLSAHPQERRVTLVATEAGTPIGTMSLGFDSPRGLRVEELFADEVATLREQDLSVCEFTKLAMDSAVRSNRVLGSLFHTAFVCAHRALGVDRLLIEVNPRHVGYYQRMLGFSALSEARQNPRVDAPAVLMMLDCRWAQDAIERLGGTADQGLSGGERSLYPYFFSPTETRAIESRVHASLVQPFAAQPAWNAAVAPQRRASDAPPAHWKAFEPSGLAPLAA